MTPGPLLTLAASLASADAASCAAAYKPEHLAEWGATKADWDAHCVKGYDPLREVQRASVARCRAKFQPYEAKGKIPTGQSQAYCAQGAAGRAELAAAAGIPVENAAPPPPPRVPKRKPGSAGMGPVGQALTIARDVWKPDACLTGLRYIYRPLSYADCNEIETARREGRGERVTVRTGSDKFDYYFNSASSERDIYRVSLGEHFTNCPDTVAMWGPVHENSPKTSGLTQCLGKVDVEVGQAFDIAVRNGWKADVPAEGTLASFPTGFFAKACGSSTRELGVSKWDDVRVDCGDGDWDMAKLRRATGGPVWVLSTAAQTAVIDAMTGRLRFMGGGAFKLDVPVGIVPVGGMGERPR